MGLSRVQLAKRLLLAAVAGLLAMAIYQGIEEGDPEWAGLVLFAGAVMIAVPLLVVLGVLMLAARHVAEEPLPFCLAGPLVVSGLAWLFDPSLLKFVVPCALGASIAFFLLVRFAERRIATD